MPTDTPTTALPPAGDPAEMTDEAVCPNCRHSVEGDYCSACGQKATPLRQPVHHFLRDAIREYFGIDGRLWTSLRMLLVHPGRLTQEYFAGRRVRYLGPLRLYLSATLLFFFLLSVLDPVAQVQGFIANVEGDDQLYTDTTVTAAAHLAAVDSAIAAYDGNVARLESLVDSLRDVPGLMFTEDSLGGSFESLDIDIDEVPADLREHEVRDLVQLRGKARTLSLRRLEWQRRELAAMAPDSLIRPADWAAAAEVVIPSDNMELDLPEWLPRSRSVERLTRSRTSGDRAAALADFTRSMIGQLPTVMFLLLPIFALLLKLIYVRRGWFYSEHLVFALHTHAFAFLVFALVAVLLWSSGGAAWVGVASQVLAVGIPIYFFVAQKRVYGQGWLKTGFKAFLLGGAYSILLFWGLVGAVLLAAAL